MLEALLSFGVVCLILLMAELVVFASFVLFKIGEGMLK